MSVPFGSVIKSKVIKSLMDDGGTLNLSEYNNYYAHLPAITARLEGDMCPLLRAILLRASINEVSGEGSTWWDFTYKGVWFTVELLVPRCGGSILYPRSCTALQLRKESCWKKLPIGLLSTRNFAREVTSNDQTRPTNSRSDRRDGAVVLHFWQEYFGSSIQPFMIICF